MKKSNVAQVLALILMYLAVAHHAAAINIKNSPHDLSVGNTTVGAVKGTTEARICIFCHVPHAAAVNTDLNYQKPLWGRTESNLATEYQTYVSDTIKSLPGQPLGPSRLCLSCHDGTIAMGAPNAHKVTEVINLTPTSQNSLGTDLRDDHPISMEYYLNTEEFVSPASVKLLKPHNGINYVECTSCHDSHNNQYGNFLVMNTADQKDALCTSCHQKTGWLESTHKTGGARYVSPTPGYVAKNGCISCHKPHGAQRSVALLELAATGISIDSNCYDTCHGSAAPYSNFKPAGGMNTHTLIAGVTDSHKHTEELPLAAADKHAHCVDCHNPHQANFAGSPLASTSPLVTPASVAPNVNGPLRGVRGVSVSGAVIPAPGLATSEFEICFKCHTGQFTYSSTQVQRTFFSLNESDRFNPSVAKSYHPVAGARTGSGASLLGTATANYIYCSQCHNPHGSSLPHNLLLDNPADFSATQTQTGYLLCYSCHNVNWLMDTGTDVGKLHIAHVFGQHNPASANPYRFYRASCSACHDPHGVPAVGGSTADNSSRLINFDRRFVAAGSAYSTTGKSCSISGPGVSTNCHADATLPSIYKYNPYPYP